MKKNLKLYLLPSILILIALIFIATFLIPSDCLKKDESPEDIPNKLYFFDPRCRELLGVADKDGNYGFINKNFEEITEFIYTAVGHFSQYVALAPVRNADNKWGYIDTSGNTVIDFQYDYAGPFEKNGLAKVNKGEKYGFIDKDGNIVVDTAYYYASDFGESGYAIVAAGDDTSRNFGVINTKGELVIPTEYLYVDEIDKSGLFRVSQLDGKGIMDANGKVILPLEYTYVGLFDEKGYAFVASGHYQQTTADTLDYGLIDRSGNFIIEIGDVVRSSASSTLDRLPDLIPVYGENGRMGFKSLSGSGDIEPKFTPVPHLGFDKVTFVTEDEGDNRLFGIIDRSGNYISELRFTGHGGFYNGVAAVRDQNGLYALINEEGQLLTDFKYHRIHLSPMYDIAVVTVKGGESGTEIRYGLIDLNGREIHQPVHQSLTPHAYGDLTVSFSSDGNAETDDPFVFYSKEGEELFTLHGSIPTTSYKIRNYICILSRSDNCTSIYDFNGEKLVSFPAGYHLAAVTEDGYAVA